jgi:hypothetical protein
MVIRKLIIDTNLRSEFGAGEIIETKYTYQVG